MGQHRNPYHPLEEHYMSLQAELRAFHADFMGQVPAEIAAAMIQADLDLSASGILDRALKAGDRAPHFTLPRSTGGVMSLAGAIKDGPVVLSFYRGGWCPYCNLELRALQKALPDFTALGASLIAASPQTPDQSLSTAEKNNLAFAVLSDTSSSARLGPKRTSGGFVVDPFAFCHRSLPAAPSDICDIGQACLQPWTGEIKKCAHLQRHQ
jgi:peroxiredoxin